LFSELIDVSEESAASCSVEEVCLIAWTHVTHLGDPDWMRFSRPAEERCVSRRWCSNGSPSVSHLATLRALGHDPGMNSRVHPTYKTKYRVGNWAEYDRALVQRGDITLWLTTDAIAAWEPAPSGRRGGQRKFSDRAIETAVTLRLIFNLPLRQAEGFLRSILSLLDVVLEAPDHTTLSRRSQRLDVALHLTSTKKPIHLIVDSTGLSIVGEGEWAAAKHGGRGKRAWKKLHIGVDRSGLIVAEALTHGSADDAKTALGLLDEIEG
jgi:hypothetical protein